MEDTLVNPHLATKPAEVFDLVRQLWCEDLELRQEVADLRHENSELQHENSELRQQIEYERLNTLGPCVGLNTLRLKLNTFVVRTESSKINSSVERMKNRRPGIA